MALGLRRRKPTIEVRAVGVEADRFGERLRCDTVTR